MAYTDRRLREDDLVLHVQKVLKRSGKVLKRAEKVQERSEKLRRDK